MYERFTDRSRKVMQLANQEAQRFNHEYIGTEHILLGVVKEGTGVAANILKNLEVDLRKVRLEVEKLIQSGPDLITMGKLPQTPRAKKVIEFAMEESRNLNHSYVGTEHVLLGLLREAEGVAAQVLVILGLNLESVREETLNLVGGEPGEIESSRAGRTVIEGQWKESKPKTAKLDLYGRDLTSDAIQGRLDPIIGYESEIDRVIRVLCRRDSNNPILIGEQGFAAANVAQGVAHRIAWSYAPFQILHYRVVQWDLESMINATAQADLHERLVAVLSEVQRAKNVILFVDNIGPFLNSADASSMGTRILRLVLTRGGVRYIGATTSQVFQDHVLPNAALMRQIQAVKLPSPSEPEARDLLNSLRGRCEEYYQLNITDAALDAAVRLTGIYLPQASLSFPERAQNLIDEAGALVCHQLSSTFVSRLRAIDEELRTLDGEKKQNVAAQDFEKAAALRDQSDKLRKERFEIAQRQRHNDLDTEAVVDEHVVISVVSQLTGIPEQAIREEDTAAIPLPPAIPRDVVPEFERLQCRSILQGHGIQIQQNTGLVLMPFREESEHVLAAVIGPVMEQAGLATQAATEILRHGPDISPNISKVWERIRTAEVIVADASGQDPHVMFQLGLCLAAYRLPILLAQSSDELPANLQTLRHVIYENSDHGRERLKGDLRAAIRSFLSLSRDPSAPV